MDKKPWMADRKFFRAMDTLIESRSTTYPIISSRVPFSVLSVAIAFGPKRSVQISVALTMSALMSSTKPMPIMSSTYISV